MRNQGRRPVVWLLGGLILFLGALAFGYQMRQPDSAQNKANSSKTAKQHSTTKSSQRKDKHAQRQAKASTSDASQVTSERERPKQAPINSGIYTPQQQTAINQAFLQWAGERAEIGNMAVSDWYFDHGTAGYGDWYANTPDGPIQVQNFGHPGPAAFNIHALGGCVFYTDKDGRTGVQNLYAGSFAENYSARVNPAYPVVKYLLGDNGIVYELKIAGGGQASTNSGFGEYNDQGQVGDQVPDASFKVSDDHAAQAELKDLIKQFS